MRILHLGKYYPPELGGMEIFLRDLAEEQVRQGHEVAVLVHGRQAMGGQEEMQGGVRVLRAPSLGELAHAPLSPGYPLLLRQLMRTLRPEVLHAHLPNSSAFWPLASRGLDIPLLLHWHADVDAAQGDWRLRRLYPLYSKAENLLLQRASAVIATSPQALEASNALKPFAHLCHVVPLGRRDPAVTKGIDFKFLEEGQDPKPLICSVGRFARYKRFHVLVQAMQHLPQARLVIVGKGPMLEQVRRQCRQLDMEERVHLPGRLEEDDLQELLRRCWLFCLPSQERTEAFGLALLEAMACSRPLVTAPIAGSGVLWLNRHECTGLVARDAEAQALAEAMGRLLQDDALRQRLGRAGREFFLAHCAISTVAQSIQTLYERACLQSRRRSGEGTCAP